VSKQARWAATQTLLACFCVSFFIFLLLSFTPLGYIAIERFHKTGEANKLGAD
jgi:hypothetical protein